MASIKKIIKKLQDKPPKELPEKPDPIIKDLKQYALRTKDLLIWEHVLDHMTVCVRKANESAEDLLGLIASGAEDFAGNFTYSFLLQFEKHTLRDDFLGILKNDTTKANLIREYDKLITAYEGIFPITKELEKIHEKKIELLKLKSHLNEAIMKDREEGSNWLKSHPGFLEGMKKNERELKKLYVIKQVDISKLWTYDQSAQQTMIANLIWHEIIGCPGQSLPYWAGY